MVPLVAESPKVERVVDAAVKTGLSGDVLARFAMSLEGLIVVEPPASMGKVAAVQTAGVSKDNKQLEVGAVPSVVVSPELVAVKNLAGGNAVETKLPNVKPKANAQVREDDILVEPKAVGSEENFMKQQPIPQAQAEEKRQVSGRAKLEVAPSVKPKENAYLKKTEVAVKADGVPAVVQVPIVTPVDEGAAAVGVVVASPVIAEYESKGRNHEVVASAAGKKSVSGTNRPLVEVGSVERTAKPVVDRTSTLAGPSDSNDSEKAMAEGGTSKSASADEGAISVSKHGVEIISAGLLTHGGNDFPSRDASLKLEGPARILESPDKASVVSRELQVTASLDGSSTGVTAETASVRSEVQGFTHIAPGVLEVGVSNGTHGWLKIRAEMQDGAVTASVASGTVAGREMLHRELPALTAYLRDERLHVNALMVKEGGMEGLRDSSGISRQMGSNGSGNRREEPARTMPGQRGSADEVIGASSDGWNGWNGMEFLPAMMSGSGGWLNVRV